MVIAHLASNGRSVSDRGLTELDLGWLHVDHGQQVQEVLIAGAALQGNGQVSASALASAAVATYTTTELEYHKPWLLVEGEECSHH